MARPIKDTPTLYGKDAERFLESIENPNKISKEERKRIMKDYSKMLSIMSETSCKGNYKCLND